ncbi:MAG: hypothetical protein PWP28_610 [Oceanotoga sp.]|uniref:endonuclease/exonuclease/phosphatase family protein n=1 Tax=Oceanotoga sp. TaxID=2108366 RepID=UPI0026553BB9|nr:endonuclease/exonuclease/phosphatase family protein [Oceanotoga sp.]MDN5341735.1 hypothetical protein [Oceanotoga sp.]
MFKWILRILIFIFVLIAIFFGYYTFIDFKPSDYQILKVEEKNKTYIEDEFTIVSWNIGYAGMGKNMDYFMDGGTRNNPNEEESLNNFENIKKILGSMNGDIILLQEVDIDSKRSFYINQYDEIKEIFKDYNSSMGFNYVNPYIPFPFNDPIGKVNAGLVEFSKYKPILSARYKLPGEYKWPLKLFHLDRCMLEMRFAFKDREVIVINTHNSAFDKGNLRKEQMEFIKNKALKEYENGNWVIIGGDWNMKFPEITDDFFESTQGVQSWVKTIDENLMPEDWKWVYDSKVPTSRSADIVYEKGVNYTTILDGFLVSPNVEVLNISADDLQFEFTDHNPVKIKLKLK